MVNARRISMDDTRITVDDVDGLKVSFILWNLYRLLVLDVGNFNR